jgi:hypothetical protein
MSNSVQPSAGGVTDPETNLSPQTSLYRIVWRWHGWAGLFVVPFILFMSLTGLPYLWQWEIEEVFHSRLALVTPSNRSMKNAPIAARTDGSFFIHCMMANASFLTRLNARTSTTTFLRFARSHRKIACYPHFPIP